MGELTRIWIKVAEKPIRWTYREVSIQHWKPSGCPAFQKGAFIGPEGQQEAWKKVLGKQLGYEELKRQRHPVSEFPPGHGFGYPALQKLEPTFLMVWMIQNVLSPHTRTYDWKPFRWGPKQKPAWDSLSCFRAKGRQSSAASLFQRGDQGRGFGLPGAAELKERPSVPGPLPWATQPLVRAWGGDSHVPLASQPGEDTCPLRNV